MPYSDKSYFLTKISETELAKLVNDDDANLDEAIRAADSIIDSYLITHIAALPLPSVPVHALPPLIRQLSFDIALFHLHDRIQYADIPERIRAKYDAAIFWLKDFARGQANLPGVTVDAEVGIFYEVNPPKFNRSTA